MSSISTRVWVLLLLLSFTDITWAAARAITVSNWWPAIVVSRHPWLRLPLTLAYNTLFAQITLSIAWFSWLCWDHRNAEFLTNLTLGLLLTTAVFCLYPTLGPCVDLPECRDSYLHDLLGLRSGNLPSIDVMVMTGVIAFPSFHAVFAVMFTYAHRNSVTFPAVAVLNLLMLFSIPRAATTSST